MRYILASFMRYYPLLIPAVAVTIVAAPAQASITEAEAKAFMVQHEKFLNENAARGIEEQLDKDVQIVVNGDVTLLGRKDFLQVLEDAYKNYKSYKAVLQVLTVQPTATGAVTEGITTETFKNDAQSETAQTKWKYTLEKKSSKLVVTKIELSSP